MDEDEELTDGFKIGGSDDDEILDDDAMPADLDFGLDEEDPDKDH